MEHQAIVKAKDGELMANEYGSTERMIEICGDWRVGTLWDIEIRLSGIDVTHQFNDYLKAPVPDH